MKGLVRFVSPLEDGTPEDVSFPPGVLPLPKPDENQPDFISVGRLTHSAVAADFSMTLANA